MDYANQANASALNSYGQSAPVTRVGVHETLQEALMFLSKIQETIDAIGHIVHGPVPQDTAASPPLGQPTLRQTADLLRNRSQDALSELSRLQSAL